jgi:RNA polymerase sigma-70 factor (ECF subfamily)
MLGTMSSPAVAADPEELRLVESLRRGDEAAFMALVRRHGPQMLRVARMYVGSDAAAEDVVQETWLGVIQGLDRFEERSSLKTWIFRILVNRARTRGERESRTRPFSSLDAEAEGLEPAVDPGRFDAHGRFAGYWSAPPDAGSVPEDAVMLTELGQQLIGVLDGLPPAQRTVITLRDVHGLSSAEVCDLLGLSEVNQRVLLHRARSRARAALERFADAAPPG